MIASDVVRHGAVDEQLRQSLAHLLDSTDVAQLGQLRAPDVPTRGGRLMPFAKDPLCRQRADLKRCLAP